MSYYYLISGLPELELDSSLEKVRTDEILDTIQRNLNEEDQKQFRYLLHPNDNRNLLDILLKKFKDFPEPTFRTPATLDQQDLEDYHKKVSDFPEYIDEYLDEYEDQFKTIAPAKMEEGLWSTFYRSTQRQCRFIANYFEFEKMLEGIFAAYNSDYFSFLNKATGDEDQLFGQFGKGKSISPMVLNRYPLLEEVEEKVASGNPFELERLLDRIKWEYLDEVEGFFGRDQVLAYTSKLLMVWRWQSLDPKEGQRHFDRFCENIRSKNRSSKPTVL